MQITTALRKGAATLASALLLSAVVSQTAEASPNASNIRYGNSGYSVSCIQKGLNAWNAVAKLHTPRPSLVVDGVFGNATLAMVQDYQSWTGIDADGVVGRITGDQLYGNWIAPIDSGCYGYVPTSW
ncbi:peptidoglycan-binding domain-containing protein [Streptomyces sp. NPDC046374]|uniref:peptidoglycan-binding domain-containing protein n=1 Tax=Streptomyces sp. NPDC046374 TaxID=3154917 RepID=UPI0033D6E5ED